jgi:hypothetical protein
MHGDFILWIKATECCVKFEVLTALKMKINVLNRDVRHLVLYMYKIL